MVVCSTVGAARVSRTPPGGFPLDLHLRGRGGNEDGSGTMLLLSNHAQASSGVAQNIVLVSVMIRRVIGNYNTYLMLCSLSVRFTARTSTSSPKARRNPSRIGGRECSENPVAFPTGSALHHGRSTWPQATHTACTLRTAGSTCGAIQRPGKASLSRRGPRAHTAPGHATGTGAAPVISAASKGPRGPSLCRRPPPGTPRADPLAHKARPSVSARARFHSSVRVSSGSGRAARERRSVY
ncbi:hypothetical protein NDU88_007887 [Pleurodeles waltl]|uniref:Uncharacterized protein n=1 Tax=Pleurodeles waltl TaxID=8319 RepID=A0AAV7NXT2_PLEWA|nr:hypothetical protein NDU88_007887 [Pleurodeles waltl]